MSLRNWYWRVRSHPMFAKLGVNAHTQLVTHHYLVHYPEHEPRTSDPYYYDFEEYRKRTKATAQCAFAVRVGTTDECTGPLQLHHDHLEFAMQNGVDFTWLERDYPGVSDPNKVGAWIESANNLVWYCEFHHIGAGGVHCASSADFEAEHYVRKLIEAYK
jgi:hypothetical protein